MGHHQVHRAWDPGLVDPLPLLHLWKVMVQSLIAISVTPTGAVSGEYTRNSSSKAIAVAKVLFCLMVCELHEMTEM